MAEGGSNIPMEVAPAPPAGDKAPAGTVCFAKYTNISNAHIKEIHNWLKNNVKDVNEDRLKNLAYFDVNKEFIEAIPNYIKVIEYQGFNPAIIAKLLLRVQGDKDEPVFSKRTIDNMTFMTSDNPHVYSDGILFITLFLTRGNAVGKIISKSSPEIKDFLRTRMAAYGISTNENQRRRPLKNTDITLSRICATLPHITAAAITKYEIIGKFVSITTPMSGSINIFTHTILPLLLDEVNGELGMLATLFNVEISYMLSNQKEKIRMGRRNLDSLLDKAGAFVRAGASSSMLSSDAKFTILKTMDVLNADDTPWL